ncbi:MAG: hypothetical protein KKA79_01920, partial [Nanoarchaeota archaeon]|nr:hypothetical protein [Nanoarchaeota archaeon]
MPEEIVAFETSKSEDEGYIDLSKKNDIEIIRVKKRKKKSAKPKKRAKPKKEEYDLLGGETKFSDIRLPNLKHLRLDELDDAAADDFTKIIKDFKRELNERVKEKERMLSEKLQTQIRKNNMALENAKINLEERYLRKYKREVAAKIREEKLLLAKRFEADYKQRVADFKDKNNMLLVDKKSKLRNSLNKELEDKSSKFQKKTEKIFSDKKRVLEKEVAIKTKNLDNDYKNKITQFKKGFADLRSELQQKDFELDEKELDVVSEMEAREAGLELLGQGLEKDQEKLTLELNAQRSRIYGEQAK